MMYVSLCKVALVLICGLKALAVVKFDNFDWPEEGPWIVEFSKDIDHTSFKDTLETLYAQVGNPTFPLNITQEYHLVLWGVALSGLTFEQLNGIIGVTNVDPDSIRKGDASSWGISRIDQENLPMGGSYNPAYTGNGINMYVLDTGIDCTHTEFSQISCSNIYAGYGTLTNNNDDNGHGTHCAGTTAGRTVGVARNVQLYGAKVLNTLNSGSTSIIIAGMDACVSHCRDSGRRCVFSVSLGGTCGSDYCANDAMLNAASNAVEDFDIVVSVSAMNDFINAGRHRSPAAANNVLTVGATDINDVQASFSNFGEIIDIWAPGKDIISACCSYLCGSSTRYSSYSGTSMACPHVSGVAAMLLQKNPSASVAEVVKAMTCDAAKSKLELDGQYTILQFDTLSKNLLLQVPKNDGLFGSCDYGAGCTDSCSGHGVCHPAHRSTASGSTANICHCDGGYYGTACENAMGTNYPSYPVCNFQGAAFLRFTCGDGWDMYGAYQIADAYTKIVTGYSAYDGSLGNPNTYCITPGYYVIQTSQYTGDWDFNCGGSMTGGASALRYFQVTALLQCREISESDLPDTAPPTGAPTRSPVANPTSIPTHSPTHPPTSSPTRSPTKGPTASPTARPTAHPTPKPTAVPTAHPTTTPTARPSPSPTVTPTVNPTTPTPTASPTTNPTANPTAKPTVTPTVNPTTSTPTADPTTTPTARPSPSPTVTPTVNPTTPTPTASPTTNPTASPTVSPSAEPSAIPTTRPTSVPTPSPTSDPTAKPTSRPTSVPTEPTAIPTLFPTQSPTFEPTGPSPNPTTPPPTANPSVPPSPAPSTHPTPAPSSYPTVEPTIEPSAEPTLFPSSALAFIFTVRETLTGVTYDDYLGNMAQHDHVIAQSILLTLNYDDIEATVNQVDPESAPTPIPTSSPPTPLPSASPTNAPSDGPTTHPSPAPTARPSAAPTVRPTARPSVAPTIGPTARPSTDPTAGPTARPSAAPSARPTLIFRHASKKNLHTILDTFFVREVDGYSIEVEVFVPNALMLGFPTIEEAYETMSRKLREAARNGTLAENLHTAARDEGLEELESATLHSFSVEEEAHPTVAPTLDPNFEPFWNAQTTAGVAMGIIGGLALILLCYLLLSYARKKNQKPVGGERFDSVYIKKMPPQMYNPSAPPGGLGLGASGRPISATPEYEMSETVKDDNVMNPMKVKWGEA